MALACRVCKNYRNNKVIFPKEMTLGIRREFKYIECSKCNSLSINTIPNNLENYYQSYPSLKVLKKGFGIIERVIYRQALLKKNRFAMLALDLDKRYDSLKLKALTNIDLTSRTKILDVGCGSGRLVNQLRSIGIDDVMGIDPFLDNGSHLSKDRSLRKTTIFDLEEKFDLIMFHHSFEHIDEFHMLPKKIDSLLPPGGKCLIRIPNIESFSYKFFKEDWEGIHAPYHIVLPSRKGMHALFEQTSLKNYRISWEQPAQLLFHSLNRQMNIADFDPLGARLFYSNKWNRFCPPPLFTYREYRYWKKKGKLLAKTHLCDYVNYYFEKKIL